MQTPRTTRHARATQVLVVAVALSAAPLAYATPANPYFDDIKLASWFIVGDEIVTGGVPVTFHRYYPGDPEPPVLTGSASIEHVLPGCPVDASEASRKVFLDRIVVGFDFGSSPASEMTFIYYDASDMLNLEINGERAVFHGFDQAPAELGGVSIENSSMEPHGCGTLVLRGSMTEVRIGGNNLWIDADSKRDPLFQGGGVLFQRGDTDGNGGHDISDPLRVLGFLFAGADPLPCDDAADADDSGTLTISDAVLVLNWLFAGGRAPSSPFGECGADFTRDHLGCLSGGVCD